MNDTSLIFTGGALFCVMRLDFITQKCKSEKGNTIPMQSHSYPNWDK